LPSGVPPLECRVARQINSDGFAKSAPLPLRLRFAIQNLFSQPMYGGCQARSIRRNGSEASFDSHRSSFPKPPSRTPSHPRHDCGLRWGPHRNLYFVQPQRGVFVSRRRRAFVSCERRRPKVEAVKRRTAKVSARITSLARERVMSNETFMPCRRIIASAAKPRGGRRVRGRAEGGMSSSPPPREEGGGGLGNGEWEEG